ncbi:hypothetical protein TNCV_1754591 [Trichonephila clavipes]|nr:hypothetical protein TNCV_1754591 [Trichonephila clavipes]
MKTIVLIPGIDRKIGGKTEIMRDTPIIADHKGNLIDSKTKVSQIIADSRVDAKVDNRINHSTVKAVDKVGREIVSFRGQNERRLFSDQPGLTHVVYHEIDTGDKGLVVSRPYKYDRVKQGIIDYHIDKMLRDGTICLLIRPMHLSRINSKRTMTFLRFSRGVSFRDRLSETKWNSHQISSISITGY